MTYEPMSDAEFEAWRATSTSTGTPIVIQPTKLITGAAPRVEVPTLSDVHATFRKWMHLPDTGAIDLALATYVAHRSGEGDPLWTLIVGPSSSGKTEPLLALSGLPGVHRLSALTGQTFASGLQGKGRRVSLLNRLADDGKDFLILKDFTTVLSMYRDARQEVLAQLREIYDGQFTKEFGTGESVDWSGRMGFVGGVTQAIDRHHTVMAVMGQRFVLRRMPHVPPDPQVNLAMDARRNERVMREELGDVVRRFITGLDLETEVPLSEAARHVVSRLAIFTTRARSDVYRDPYGTREILEIPEVEAPMRFAKQLAALVCSLQVLGFTEDEALEAIVRVAKDCVPPIRLQVLGYLQGVGVASTSGIGEGLDLPATTAGRVAEDLTALRILRRTGGGQGKVIDWHLGEYGETCPW